MQNYNHQLFIFSIPTARLLGAAGILPQRWCHCKFRDSHCSCPLNVLGSSLTLAGSLPSFTDCSQCPLFRLLWPLTQAVDQLAFSCTEKTEPSDGNSFNFLPPHPHPAPHISTPLFALPPPRAITAAGLWVPPPPTSLGPYTLNYPLCLPPLPS